MSDSPMYPKHAPAPSVNVPIHPQAASPDIAATAAAFSWSTWQKAVLDAVDLSLDSLCVEACAGSGKTTLLIECARRLVARGEDVLLLAYDRKTTERLRALTQPLPQRRGKQFPTLGRLQVRSFNGVGYVALDDWFGGSNETRSAAFRAPSASSFFDAVDPLATPGTSRRQPIKAGQTPAEAVAEQKAANQLGWTLDEKIDRARALQIAKRVSSKPAKLAEHLDEIVVRAKNMLIGHDDLHELSRIARGLCIAKNESDATRLAGLASEVMQLTSADPQRGGYTDMAWLAIQLDAIKPFRGTVLVDEAQDLNALFHEVLRRVAGPRVLLFGDSYQGIYEWNGAVPDGLRRLSASFYCTVLDLPVSYRNPQVVSAEARKVNPKIVSHESCGYGALRDGASIPELIGEVPNGAVVLSRSGRGAFEACLALREAGKQAVVSTHGVGKTLLRLLKRSEATSVDGLRTYLETLLATLQIESDSTKNYEDPLYHLLGSAEILLALCEGQSTITSVKRLVEQTTGRGRSYSDAAAQRHTPETLVRCGTVHSFKGQEAENVWLLIDTFHDAFGARATDEGRKLWYTAVTRSKHSLTYVSGQFERERSGRRFY